MSDGSTPLAFNHAPEHEAIALAIKAAIVNVNDIINILNHPVALRTDIIDMNYSVEMVEMFRVLCDQCERNLQQASSISATWFTSLSDRMARIVNELSRLEDEAKAIEERERVNQIAILHNVDAIQISTKNAEYQRVMLEEARARCMDAERRYNDAKKEQDQIRMARNALFWVPLVAIALTAVDLVKEQNAVNAAQRGVRDSAGQVARDNRLLQELADQLGKERDKGMNLQKELINLHVEAEDMKEKQGKLHQLLGCLTPLRVAVDLCIHTVSGALGSGANLDNMMSMYNVGQAIKGLVTALDYQHDFSGALAILDEKGFGDLDKRIQMIQMKQSASKKVLGRAI